MTAPRFVLVVVRNALQPYLIGRRTGSGDPLWSARRDLARRWDNEAAAVAWIDATWPWLRAELVRAGMPITFEGEDSIAETLP